MKFVFAILTFVPVISSAHALADKMAEKSAKAPVGVIYDLNGEKNSPLFTIKADLKPNSDGTLHFSSHYMDSSKSEAMSEDAVFKQMDVQNYTIRQFQLNETYELRVSGNKMNFSWTKGDEVKTKSQDLPKNLIVGPSFTPFFQKHWNEIQGKKKVEANLAVLDYMDTFCFEFEKLSSPDEKNGVLVRMQLASPILSVFVKPIYFLVQNDGSRILEFRGQMLVKQKVKDGWEDFQGRAVFTY
jgi:hypothetical protein